MPQKTDIYNRNITGYDENYIMFGLDKKEIEQNPRRVDEFFVWADRYVDTILPSVEEAKQMFDSGRKLSFYLGIDPTGPDIHLGHSTNFFLLKKLIEMGHEAVLLIGDFTAQIGDPTGKSNTRKALTKDEVEQNMSTYLEQATKILPKDKFKVRYNSEWHRNMTFQKVIEIASYFTVQQMITRDMFQERLKKEEAIHLQEFLYPLVQGYDSVALETDAEIGGTDQMFNMLAGRTLEKKILGKEKLVITTKLLEDPLTKKKIMNKSEGSYISMRDNAADMFGKVMSMPDSAIIPLYRYTTDVPLEVVQAAEERLKTENPRDIKAEVGSALVRIYHGEEAAVQVSEDFRKVFSQGELPENMPELSGEGQSVLDFIAEHRLAESRSEAKRLLEQKAVRVNSLVATDWGQKLSAGDVIQVGPRKFAKVS